MGEGGGGGGGLNRGLAVSKILQFFGLLFFHFLDSGFPGNLERYYEGLVHSTIKVLCTACIYNKGSFDR